MAAEKNMFPLEHWSAPDWNQFVGGFGSELGVGGSKHFDPAKLDEGWGEPYRFGEPFPEPRPWGLLVGRAGMAIGLEKVREHITVLLV